LWSEIWSNGDLLLINKLHGWSAVNENDDRLRFNGNNWNDNNDSHAFGIALATKTLRWLKHIMLFIMELSLLEI